MEVNITGQSKPSEVTCVAEVKPLDIGISSENGEALSAFGVCEDEEEDKLCGWLSVRPNTRLLPKINKQRYFVFSDKTCKLYHYRSQHDMLPLGEIDIYNASFNFEASNLDKPGLFEIRSEGKIYSLDASNRVNMMYWLQALQKKRRKYSETRASKDPVRQLSKKSILALSGESDGTASTSESQTSAQTQASSSRTRIWSLAALQSEIVNILNSHKQQRAPANSSKNDEWLMVDNVGDIPTVTVTDASKTFEHTKSFDSAKSSESLKSGDTVKSSDTPKTPDATKSQNSDKTPDSPKLVETPTKQPDASKQAEGNKAETLKNRTPDKGKSTFKWKLKKTPKGSESPNSGGYSCEKCRQFEQESMTLKDDMSSVEEELEASRVVVSFLQKEIDQLQRQLNTRSELEKEDKKGVEEMLKVRDDNIVKLEHLLAMTKEEKENHVASTQKIKNENESLQQQVKKLQDEIKEKEICIAQQTKQTEELIKESRKGSHTQWYEDDGTTTKVISDNFKKLEILNDMVRAYEMQNKFLSIEILELNELRQQSEKREKLLSMELAKQEAKYYKIMSKYLIILENLKKATQGESGHKPEVVKQLLEEVLDSELNFKGDFAYSQTNSPEYDMYGFARHAPSKDGDLLSVRASEMQRKSEELNTNIKEIDEKIVHQYKWDNFMTGLDKRELQRSSELKALIRSGVPYEYKERIWSGCVSLYVGHRRKTLEPDHYQNLVAQVMNQKPNPEAKQIELDLLRTLPNNKYYMSLESEKIHKLRRVLLAFSWQCSSVGYCQGLNRLAAVALLFLNEEDAFWCLVVIVEYLLPQDYYSSSMVAAQTDQRVLKDLVQEKLPRLHAYLEKESIDLSLFTFNWFLTIFVDNVPPETFLRIWDTFLYEGSKVLFRFAVSFFKVAEEEIVSQKNNMAVNKYLQVIGENMVNLNQIGQIAFHWLNPFPMRSIASKRQFHLQQVKAELAQLDALREAYRVSQAVAKQNQKEEEEKAANELKPEEKSSEIINSEDDD